jgi:hypothetical protein
LPMDATQTADCVSTTASSRDLEDQNHVLPSSFLCRFFIFSPLVSSATFNEGDT